MTELTSFHPGVPHFQFHIGGSETESLDDLTEDEEEEEESSETRSERTADA